jgi:hypothetical protein
MPLLFIEKEYTILKRGTTSNGARSTNNAMSCARGRLEIPHGDDAYDDAPRNP